MNGPPRQQRRTDAGSVDLSVNLFRLRPVGNMTIFKHHVSFTPADCARRIQAAAVRSIPAVGSRDFILSGNTLLLRSALEAGEKTFLTKKEEKIVVSYQAGKQVDVTKPDSLAEALSLNNMVLRRSMRLMPGLSQLGRNFADLTRSTYEFPRDNIALYRGMELSSAAREAGALVQLDIFNKVLSSVNVYEILMNRRISARELQGMGVITIYNNTYYRVRRVADDLHPTDSFERKNGERVTFADYAEKMYHVKILHPEQPMLVVTVRGRRQPDGTREEREVHLIPELCRMVGYTPSQKGSLPLRREMTMKTKMSPEARSKALSEFIRDFNRVVPAKCSEGHGMENANSRQKDQKCSVCGGQVDLWCKRCKSGMCRNCAKNSLIKDGFALEVNQELLSVRGRQLASESIVHLDARGNEVEFPTRNGSWDNVARSLRYKPFTLNKWVLIFDKNFDGLSFFNRLSGIGKGGGMYAGMNIDIQPPMRATVRHNARPEEWRDELSKLMDTLPGPPDMVFVILPTAAKEGYDMLKSYLLEKQLVSQFATEAKVTSAKGVDSIFTKILIQMMAKIGFAPWRGHFENKIPTETMVVGIDSVRDKAEGGHLVTMVASTDNMFSRYCSQASRVMEGSSCLKRMFSTALEKFRTGFSGQDPKCIVVYRNGVSDAEVRNIEARDGELAQLTEALSADGKKPPSIIFVLVLRKGTTRVFSFHGNPPPGTVVDDQVTANPMDPALGDPRKDFFLISQKVLEGSVRPTHYRVLKNTTPMSIQNIEEITYKFAHLYFNWCGTVACPAPVLLAQKMTRHISEHSQKIPAGNLIDKTYYI